MQRSMVPGLIIYQQKIHFITHLPIPPLTDTQRETIGALVQQLTTVAKQRYAVRRKTTHRIENDLGTPPGKLNQQLAIWWELSFNEFRNEIVKVFKRDIPLKDPDVWETLLRERTAEIGKLTGEIVRLETLLNAEVYAAFGLNDDEMRLIESAETLRLRNRTAGTGAPCSSVRSAKQQEKQR